MSKDEIPRQSERRPLSCEIEFRRRGDVAYRVDLIDMSPEGCRINPPIRLNSGDGAWLKIPGMEAIPARVAWAKEWDAGIEFERPFYPAVFDMVVQRLEG
jgi:hypothetical protein